MAILIYLTMFAIAFLLGFVAAWLVAKLDIKSNTTVGTALGWATLSGVTGPIGIVFSGMIVLAILALVGAAVGEEWFKQLKNPNGGIKSFKTFA